MHIYIHTTPFSTIVTIIAATPFHPSNYPIFSDKRRLSLTKGLTKDLPRIYTYTYTHTIC